jgi:hypothetical protein
MSAALNNTAMHGAPFSFKPGIHMRCDSFRASPNHLTLLRYRVYQSARTDSRRVVTISIDVPAAALGITSRDRVRPIARQGMI